MALSDHAVRLLANLIGYDAAIEIATLIASGGGGGGAVSSVFTRTGVVAATAGDYTVDKITGAASTAFVMGQGFLTTNAVTSVASRTGAVVLSTGDISGLGTSATHAAGDFAAVANNLSDLASASTSRTNLGLGTSATHPVGDFVAVANNLSDVTAATARTNLGLGTLSTQSGTFSGTSSGTNTGDQNLAPYATLASPTFTGTVTITALAGILKGTAGVVGVGTEGTDYLSGASNKLPLPHSFGGTGTPTIANDVCPWLYIGYTCTAVRLTLSCLSAPTGSFTVVVKRSADSGATFPDTIATVTLASGNRLIATTTIASSALSAGDYLRLDITAVNGAANWLARLGTLSRNQ